MLSEWPEGLASLFHLWKIFLWVVISQIQTVRASLKNASPGEADGGVLAPPVAAAGGEPCKWKSLV